jgi:hypothetical protein
MNNGVRLYLVQIIGLSGILLISMTATALDTTATVISSQGAVSVITSGDQKSLNRGDQVFVKDRVETGEESFTVLKFIDGARVIIRPDSAMVIEEYTYNGNAKDTATLRLIEGGARVITGDLAESYPENFRVETPNSWLDVRNSNGSNESTEER